MHIKHKEGLEDYFHKFREGIIGNDSFFRSTYDIVRLLYADWLASGRLYAPIEHTMGTLVGPMVANPHSFSSETGKLSTYAYMRARQIIKDHVNAGDNDVLVTTGTGMTGALAHLQRVMGIRRCNNIGKGYQLNPNERPVVFITHMEHHSNHVPWMETIADVVIVPPGENALVSLENLEKLIKNYIERPLMIGAFTASSNVTGIITPYHEMAKILHRYGGYCLVDFAASAPYLEIDMHPKDPEMRLDGVLFSPHKFLGGPGSCGVLMFNSELYRADVPDVPGGGNAKWTDPWGNFAYSKDIEVREDGGTPGFLQAMRAAMAIRLKEKMGVKKIFEREMEQLQLCFRELGKIDGLTILGDIKVPRIGCISFVVEGIHYNLIVRLLNDRFGIQVRGGWSCASTYGHYILDVSKKASGSIVKDINNDNLGNKPGWVRLSLHPIMTNEELYFICDSIKAVVKNFKTWQQDYSYNPKNNEYEHKQIDDSKKIGFVDGWFD